MKSPFDGAPYEFTLSARRLFMLALLQIVRCFCPSVNFSRSALAGLLTLSYAQSFSMAGEDEPPVTTAAPVLKLTQEQPVLAPPINAEKPTTQSVESTRRESPEKSSKQASKPESIGDAAPEAKGSEQLSEDGWRARKPGSPLIDPNASEPRSQASKDSPLPNRLPTQAPKVSSPFDSATPIGMGVKSPKVQKVEAKPQASSPEPVVVAPNIANPPSAKQPTDATDDLIDAMTEEDEIIRDLRLPVRRPAIRSAETQRGTESQQSPHSQSPSQAQTSNERSLRLQEDIEDYEDLPAEPSPETASDEYANPLLDTEVKSITEPSAPRRTEPEATKLAVPAAILKMQEPIAQCLQYYYRRPENARERTPWGMLHGILPFGIDSQIDNGRQRYNSIAWLAGNNPGRNLKIFSVSPQGQLIAREGVGLQGHQAQLLAIFAQAGVPIEYPLVVNGRRFSMESLVRTEMAACKSGNELTFTLIGLSNYLPTDTRWKSADGQTWDFERVLREELAQPVVGAACGGTHRLMGFSYALKQRKLEGLPITGQWARAETYIKDFTEYAWELQNRDGSFSTKWFEGREDDDDQDRKLQTTGHILEWLVYTLPTEQLTDPRVTRSVSFVANTLIRRKNEKLEVGPKGHALRALSLYHTKVFDSNRPWLGTSSPNPQAKTAQNGSAKR